MRNIFERNIKSLKEENEDIRAFLQNNIEDKNVQVLEAGTEIIEDRKILYVVKEGHPYQLDSLYNEKPILDKWYNQFNKQNYRSRYLLFGFGNGMYVRKILDNVGPEAVVIVFEPSVEIFRTAMEEFDLADILENEQVHLLLEGISETRMRDLLGKYFGSEDMEGSILRYYLNYQLIFPEQYEQFQEAIRFHVNRLGANKTLMQRMGVAYFDNTMANYPYIIKQKSLIDLSRKLPKDIPAILVSAGPSLDKNVEELKRAKNKCFILAVDAAAKVLVKHHILPDAVITIDALKLYQHFTETEVQHIPLIANPHCSRGIMCAHKGDKYFLQDDNTHLRSVFDKFNKMVVDIDGGGSVATYGYALLERLQFKTIILVGQDLAYTNNRTHSTDTVRGEMNLNIFDKDTLLVEDIYGNMITTSYEFQIYQDWFEEELRVNSEYRVIDATEGGAKIKGTIIKTLAEALMEECHTEVDMDGIMKSIVPRLTEDEQKQIKMEITNIPEKLLELEHLVKKSIRNYEKMLQLIQENRYRSGEMKRMFQRTKEMLEAVENAPEYYYVWCISFAEIEEEFSYDLFAEEEDEKEEIKASIMQALRYSKVLEQQIKNCIVKVKEWLEYYSMLDTRSDSIEKIFIEWMKKYQGYQG